jgi:hypothetical protein
VQSVCFEKLALGFDSDAQTSSSLRRIQRFIAKFELDNALISQFVFSLIPKQENYILAIDRTNWKFGDSNINALVLSIHSQNITFPLMLSMLDKRGNSSTKERIDLIERFIQLFGKEKIRFLLADREFVGNNWLGYLKKENISFYIRIRNNFIVINPRNGKRIKVSVFFNDLSSTEFKYLENRLIVNGELCYLSGSKIKNKLGEPELQILICMDEPNLAKENYALRWKIESAFKALKSSGFNIEDTHLTDQRRIQKLFMLVFIAYAWTAIVGIYIHYNVKKIKLKTHGRMAKSIIKCGLEYIANCLLCSNKIDHINIFKFLSCT